MVDNAVLEEAKRRGLISSDKSAILEEAKRRGLIKEPSTMDRIGSFVSDTAQSAANLVTGNDRRQFQYGELPPILTEKGMSDARMSLGRDDLRKLDILRKSTNDNIPGFSDDYGNIYVTLDDQRAKRYGVEPGSYYLNNPGISGQDVSDVMTTGAIEAVTTLGLSRLLGPLVPGGRILGAATGAASGSALQDVAATTAGSERGIDGQAALIAGLIGGGGEALGQVIAPTLRKWFSRNPFDASGNLDSKTRDALTRLGIDPYDVTPDWVARFNEAARQSVNPEGAVSFADARTLPVEVPLSRGDVTRAIPDQRFESGAIKGNFGKPAQETMETFRNTQQAALAQNVDEIGRMVGTGDDLVPGEGMRQVGQRLVDDAEALTKAGRAAYDEAGAMGMRVDADGVKNFVKTARAELASKFPSREVRSQASNLLDDLDAMVSGTNGATVSKLNINNIEAWRQDLDALRRAAGQKGEPSAVVLGNLKGRLDDFLDGAVDQALVTGDTATLDKFKEARGIWRELRQRYDSNAVVSNILEAARSGEQPEGLLRYLFEANGVGFKRGAVQGVRQLKEVLGDTSPEWNALRGEAFSRLLKSNAKGNVRDAAGNLTFSGDKFSTAFRKAMGEGGDLMRELFTPEEISLMRKFERVALRATNRRGDAMNPSGTGADVIQFVQGLLSGTPGGRAMLGVVGKVLGGMGDYGAASQAVQATTRALPSPQSSLPSLLSVTGAVGAQQTPEQQQYQPPR